LLNTCGFSVDTIEPYMSAQGCRFWDALDVTACIGCGRYRLSAALHRIARVVLPARARNKLAANLSKWLCSKVRKHQSTGPGTAALVVASKGK